VKLNAKKKNRGILTHREQIFVQWDEKKIICVGLNVGGLLQQRAQCTHIYTVTEFSIRAINIIYITCV